MLYILTHFFLKHGLSLSLVHFFVADGFKVIKGHLRGSRRPRKISLSAVKTSTWKKGRESDTRKSKAAVDRDGWEQQSCRGGAHCTACQAQRSQSLTALRHLSERFPCLARPCQWLLVQWWIISSMMRNFISLFTILHLATSKHKGELTPRICGQIEFFLANAETGNKRNWQPLIRVFSDPIEDLCQSSDPKTLWHVILFLGVY